MPSAMPRNSLFFFGQSMSAEAKDLMLKLLEFKPEERLSATDALQHPWIRDRTVAP